MQKIIYLEKVQILMHSIVHDNTYPMAYFYILKP